MQGFVQDAMVLLTLHSPRQKFFGLLLELSPCGVGLRGVPVESLEDMARQIRGGEHASASTLFFPMHRVERMELDEPAGELPSLGESFAESAGRSVAEIFGHRSKAGVC